MATVKELVWALGSGLMTLAARDSCARDRANYSPNRQFFATHLPRRITHAPRRHRIAASGQDHGEAK
jgi:hypothetical protein